MTEFSSKCLDTPLLKPACLTSSLQAHNMLLHIKGDRERCCETIIKLEFQRCLDIPLLRPAWLTSSLQASRITSTRMSASTLKDSARFRELSSLNMGLVRRPDREYLASSSAWDTTAACIKVYLLICMHHSNKYLYQEKLYPGELRWDINVKYCQSKVRLSNFIMTTVCSSNSYKPKFTLWKQLHSFS